MKSFDNLEFYARAATTSFLATASFDDEEEDDDDELEPQDDVIYPVYDDM